MTTLGIIQLLYVALALVMAGLGLSLRVSDFQGLATQKKSVALAIGLQMVVLPVIAFLLVLVFDVPGFMAVGLLLLAATPGSISANLFSHLFGGNVAFNIALTGLNTILCALTLPFIGTWAVQHFVGSSHQLPILTDKMIETISIVLGPVLLGMLVAAKAPRFAARVDKPVKVLSIAVVVLFSVGAIIKEWHALVGGFEQVGLAILLFNALSVAIGFGAAKAVGVGQREAVTIAFQVSVHNAIQAIYVALAILNEPQVALPAAVYSITMNLFALAFGLTMQSAKGQVPASAAAYR